MAKRTRKKAIDTDLPIYQVKITLQHIEPPIWRRLQMDDCSLDELHDIIQVSMGWDDEHMHAFVIEGEQYGDLERGGDFEYDSRSVRLCDLVKRGDTRFRYDYDFGDEWKHVVEIERTLSAEEGACYPRCVKGERACPPEDCGGPYGYPQFLAAIPSAKHEEHEEMLEWVGGWFDPEKFDLDRVNQELLHLRRWIGYEKSRHSPKAAFAEEDLVRVRCGTVHEQYPDIPLGGWLAKVTRIVWLTPLGYEVRWTKQTMQAAHPVYLKRCRRDDIDPASYWLEEAELEMAPDELPSEMEQPTNLITRPLSADEPDDRVRMVFGLTSDDPLPQISVQNQRRYLDYLVGHLSFPFSADFAAAFALDPSGSEEVTVFGFADPSVDPEDGIMCEARRGGAALPVPLSNLQVHEENPNCQRVEDYTYWLWEVEEDDDDEEDDDFDEADALSEEEERLQFPIGTVAFYGPDDKRTTKIVAGVIKHDGAEPILKQWVATDVMANPKVQREMETFFEKHRVKKVGMSEENMGCPHEEGEDFPVGGDCPFCPWWKGKQGSGARE